MRIRWSPKAAVPLLLLAVLYAAGAAQLAHSYSRCDLSLPDKLASGLQWAEGGWNWFTQATSRLRLDSWLGNSWAPGSIGWRAAADSPSRDSGTLTVLAAASIEEASDIRPELEPLEIAVEALHGVRVADCSLNLLVLERHEVVIVTAEFPRLPTSESGLSDLPVGLEPSSDAQPAYLKSWCSKPILPDPSTI